MKKIRSSADFSVNKKLSDNRQEMIYLHPTEEDASPGNLGDETLVEFDKSTLTWTTPSQKGYICGIFLAPENE